MRRSSRIRLWTRQLRNAFARGARPATDERPDRRDPSVSLVVCTHDRPGDLRLCLDSIAELRSTPSEVIVVDNCPSDDATRELCHEYPVRYAREATPGLARARNRGVVEAGGEVVAFTDDDCVVDPRWLDDLGDAFDDPLVMALTGYAGPLELETPSQYLFEVHGGFQRFPERQLFDGASRSPVSIAAAAGPGANCLFRRRVFEEVGLFAEDLGPGTPALNGEEKYAFYRIAQAGYRIVFDPARIVWHRHRANPELLRRTLFGYTTGEFAYTTRCLLENGELSTLAIWRWWPHHLAGDLWRWVRDDDGALSLDLILAEAAGLPLGHGSSGARTAADARPRPWSWPTTSPRLRHSPRLRVWSPSAFLSVVIASRDRRERLRDVMTALAQQSHPAADFEAVVVLDGSTDGSADMLRALQLPYRVAIFEQEQGGVASCRNRGAREASHDLILFLDDDIVPEPTFLAEHAAAHASRDELVALGYYPPVLESPGLWAYAVRAWWEDHFRRKAQPGHQWTYIDYADGNVSMPRQLLQRSGRLRRVLSRPAPGLGARDQAPLRGSGVRVSPERQGSPLSRHSVRDDAAQRAPGGEGRRPARWQAPARQGPAAAGWRGAVAHRPGGRSPGGPGTERQPSARCWLGRLHSVPSTGLACDHPGTGSLHGCIGSRTCLESETSFRRRRAWRSSSPPCGEETT